MPTEKGNIFYWNCFYAFGFAYISFFCNICFQALSDPHERLQRLRTPCKQIENICPKMFENNTIFPLIFIPFLFDSFNSLLVADG